MSSISCVGSSESLLLDYLEQIDSSQSSTSISDTSSQFESLLAGLDTVNLGGENSSGLELQTYQRFKNSGGGHEPPSMTVDHLSKMRGDMAKSGDDTSALDRVIEDFDAADVDQDGSVSADELRTYAEANGLEMPEPPEGGHGPGGEKGHHHGPPDMTEEQLTEMRGDIAESGGDTSGIDQVLEDFDAADTDQDGTVSAQEYRTYAEANGLEMPEHPKRMAESTESESTDTNSSLLSLLNKYAANNSYLSDSTTSQLLSSLQA